MAELMMITSEEALKYFYVTLLPGLKEVSDEDIASSNYISPLTDDRVTQSNMEFGNDLGKSTDANLLIWKFQGGKCYALAYATNVDENIRMELEEQLKVSWGEAYLASGTGSVDTDGTTTNIKLTLTSATDKLRFENQNIVQITDSSGNDEIYINTQGVAKKAELNFSQGGTDTIKFNGATTVQNISGGGVRREYAYSSALRHSRCNGCGWTIGQCKH